MALETGFAHCGVARAHPLEQAKLHFLSALKEDRHAGMRFLERDVEMRFNPDLLLPHCQSVIVVLYNYYLGATPQSKQYRTARYTWVKDYHLLVKERLDGMVVRLQAIEPCQCRVTVDSSCISEKNWAVEAGLGCFGKNGLVHNEEGSFFVIGTILTDALVDSYDSARISDCGSCQLCVNNCPAQALNTPYRVDASKCFSYWTVESKNPENEMLEKAPLIFGCDVCQEVCPKNEKKIVNLLDQSKSSVFLRLQNEDFENLNRETFKIYFGESAIARRRYERFYRAILAKRNNPQE